MGMPSIDIKFTEKASASIERSASGIVALVLIGSGETAKTYSVVDLGTDIPSDTTDYNKKMIAFAKKGYTNPVTKVVVYETPAKTEENAEKIIGDALTYMSAEKFDYLAVPQANSNGWNTTIETWVKTERENENLVKAVLYNSKSDNEAIVNFTTEKIVVDGNEYIGDDFVSRIAGLLAGTSNTMSATYAVLTDVDSCTRLSKENMNKAVDNGEFIIFHDGDKAKTGRAVTSLTTTNDEKGEQFKKIKIVKAMDMIKSDITKTAQDNYIGKFANTYENKMLLVVAIESYFDVLVKEKVLDSYNVDFDYDSIKAYLKEHGKYKEGMTTDELKRANVGTNVFLVGTLSMLDSIEDITLNLSI